MIRLAWPSPKLSPNSRVNWRQVRAASKLARTEAFALTKAARLRVGAGDVPVMIDMEFLPPDRRHRDLDNCISSTKAHRDGIADALGVNDRHFKLTARMGEPVKGGAVVVKVEGEARSIGEIIAPIVAQAARLAEFQEQLNTLRTPRQRKRVIMLALGWGLISRDETSLLIQAYQLETA